MISKPAEPGCLYSSLADEPDLRGIIDLFVSELPKRAETVLNKFQTRDWEGLKRAAHQLKGAAGSYGFDPIMPAAARVEDALQHGLAEDEILVAVRELVDLCRRARGTAP